MALMSRKVDYALLIFSHLHRKKEGACAREIADRFGLSRSFVANILKEICHKGFVESHRGVKGGYVLRRPAEEITLAELMDALDDPFHLAECNATPDDCACELTPICPVRGPIAEVHRRIREVLRSVNLAELFRFALPVVNLEQLNHRDTEAPRREKPNKEENAEDQPDRLSTC